MAFRILADLTVLLHLAFILFVVLGALLVFRWRRLAFLHLPAMVWGAMIEFKGWICPLTPLENRLRQAAGESGYEGGFIDHYLIPVIYPEALSHDIQILLGISVLAVNSFFYGILIRKWRGSRKNKHQA